MDIKDEEGCFGVEQLDNITLGSMEPGSFGLFTGPTGTGKSSMLYHFLFQGAKAGDNVCLISNEAPANLATRISSFKTHEAKWIKDGYISIFNITDLISLIGTNLDEAGPDEVDLLHDLIVQVVDLLDAKRLVIDPFNPILDLLETWDKIHFLQRLKNRLVKLGVTTFIGVDSMKNFEDLDMECYEPYLFDIIIKFLKEKEPPITMNTLTIERWRSSPHSKNSYVIDVSKEGVILVPRIKPLEVR